MKEETQDIIVIVFRCRLSLPPKPSLSLIGCGVKTGEMSDVNIPQDHNLGSLILFVDEKA